MSVGIHRGPVFFSGGGKSRGMWNLQLCNKRKPTFYFLLLFDYNLIT